MNLTKLAISFATIVSQIVNPIAMGAVTNIAMPSSASSQQAIRPSLAQGQVRFAMSMLASRGQTDYLLIDKNNATLHAVDDGVIVASSSIILGRIRSDNFQQNLGSTGAGMFRMVASGNINSNQRSLNDTSVGRNPNEPVIAFRASEGRSNIQYMFHRIIPTTQRLNAIHTPTASDNFLSAGCINVPDNFFNLVWNRFADSTGRLRDGLDVVILPHNVAMTESYLQRGGLPSAQPLNSATPRSRNNTLPNSDLLPVPYPSN
jgi:hypothetical protein